MEDERIASVRRHILRQIERDENTLGQLAPALDWVGRVRLTAETFIPRIVASAELLLRHVESSLNSPSIVRSIWEQVKKSLEDKALIAEMDDALSHEERLFALITGDTISKLIADFLCEKYQDLAQNNRSTYPDLYFSTADYSKLPKRTRDLAVGPALRGDKPTSVPDGIEIKSNNGARIRVDSHHDHQGLHLALTFEKRDNRYRALDLYVAYLSKADYTRATRRTTATTDKFSFGHAPFISVLTGHVEMGLFEEVT